MDRHIGSGDGGGMPNGKLCFWGNLSAQWDDDGDFDLLEGRHPALLRGPSNSGDDDDGVGGHSRTMNAKRRNKALSSSREVLWGEEWRNGS